MGTKVKQGSAIQIAAGVISLFAGLVVLFVLLNALSNEPFQRTRDASVVGDIVYDLVFLFVCVFCGSVAINKASLNRHVRQFGVALISLGLLGVMSDMIDVFHFHGLLIDRTPYLNVSILGLFLTLICFGFISGSLLHNDLHRVRKGSLQVFLIAAAGCLLLIFITALLTEVVANHESSSKYQETPLLYVPLIVAGVCMVVFVLSFVVWSFTYVFQACAFVYQNTRH